MWNISLLRSSDINLLLRTGHNYLYLTMCWQAVMTADSRSVFFKWRSRSVSSNKKCLGWHLVVILFLFLMLFCPHSLGAAFGGNYVIIKATWKLNTGKLQQRKGQTFFRGRPMTPQLSFQEESHTEKLRFSSSTRTTSTSASLPWNEYESNMKLMCVNMCLTASHACCVFILWTAEPHHTSTR